MVDVTLKGADVKFNFETKFGHFRIYPPYSIANLDNANTMYGRVVIDNQGADGWAFNGTDTQVDFDIGPNGSWNFGSVPLMEQDYSTTLSKGTHKDQVVLRARYYQNATDRDAFNDNYFREDVITLDISLYIQNDDGSWTSSDYTDESDIVFAEWQSGFFNSDLIHDSGWWDSTNSYQFGVEGKGLKITRYYEVDSGLWFMDFGFDGWYNTTSWIKLKKSDGSLLKLNDLVVAFISRPRLNSVDTMDLRMLNEYYNWTIMSKDGSYRKIVVYPTPDWTVGFFIWRCCEAHFSVRFTPPVIFKWLV